jgi:hypothetical protein
MDRLVPIEDIFLGQVSGEWDLLIEARNNDVT